MLVSHAFKPLNNSTQRVSVGSTVSTITLPFNTIDLTVYKPDYGYCRASLAKRYNDETKLIGKKIIRKKVKEIPIHLGC